MTDCINKKVKKNRGERTMYYVENSHPAIVSRDLFNQVQQEMTRRSSKRKVLQKSGKTELGKYSGKYALTELLVCGECGSPYKRVTWARNCLLYTSSQNNRVSADLPDYIMNREIVRAALRTAKEADATDQEWQEFIDRITQRAKKSKEGGEIDA